MNNALKEARTICKTILRNGYDAYIINPQLQQQLAGDAEMLEVDIACEPDFEELARMFNNIERVGENGIIASLREEDVVYHFYKTDIEDSSTPEKTLMRVSTRMLRAMYEKGRLPHRLSGPDVDHDETYSIYDDFMDTSSGVIAFRGLPVLTLRGNYLLAIRAMRLSANLQLPIEPVSWMAIVQSAGHILDYVPAQDIMQEWQAVEPVHMWNFVQLLFESFMLHGIMPEVASLSRISYTRPDGQEENILEHAIECMRYYPEGDYKDDWLGTFAMLVHEVGKLFTVDFFDGSWTFFQHHRVGAKVVRKILRNLRLPNDQIEIISHLVLHHIRFQAMLTDRGIRRFKALDEYPRLIEMARAKIKASNESATNFNHNMKYLARAEVPEAMVEPLLNGNEIMDFTGLQPGPQVGEIREALLKAQIAGVVNSMPEAVDFVLDFKRKHYE